ncbi:MAG: nucleoside-diphosphate sugar epimerase/dehydratase [Chitinophagaceae bacterium]
MFININIVPRWIIFLLDLIICSIALCLSSFIRYNLSLLTIDLRDLTGNLLILGLINAVVFINFRTYAGIIRYTGIQDALRIFYAVVASTSILFLINLILTNFGSLYFFSTTILIINALISFLFLITYRVIAKYSFSYLRSYKMDKKNVIIYGAAAAGFATKRVLEHDAKSFISVVAFIDDDLKKIGKVVDGIKIRNTKDLERIVALHQIDEIIIAVFELPPAKKNKLVDFCLEKNIKVLNIPPFESWINGEFSARQLQKIKIEDLLERDQIKISNELIASQISDKRILVTGAAGSIGSEIVRQLLKYNPQTIILCDQAETPLHELELELEELHTKTSCISFLGNVTNQKRMEELFEMFQPQYVYHAAAYKHVPMMELCPSEAIITNVLGTKILVDLSVKYAVQRFVMVSTDKAVNPTNIMGASKRLAEIYVQSMHHFLHSETLVSNKIFKKPVKFITTRFGNVLGSNGSVITRFKEQIEKGGPVTVTHPNITRFFMTIPEACQLVLEAGSMGKGGEIFVFDMGKAVAIVELAKKMIRLYGLTPGVDIEIKYSGLRPGEKLYEELLTDSENSLLTYHDKIMIAKVREYDFGAVENEFIDLINLAKQKDGVMEMVAKMKDLVPEFVSNNSVFEQLDKNNSRKVISMHQTAANN